MLVKTLACGICGSDLHALHHMEHMIETSRRASGGGDGGPMGGGFDPTADTVFGHEFCAEILEHGPGTTGLLKPGTRVVSVPATITGTGVELLGYSNNLPGGFAERMILSEMMLLEVKNGLPTDQAALTEPFAVGAHAVAKARLDKDSVSLVIGCGPVGLAVIAGLKAKGHGPVIAADYSPRRRAAAEMLGADLVIDPAAEPARPVGGLRRPHGSRRPEHGAHDGQDLRPTRGLRVRRLAGHPAAPDRGQPRRQPDRRRRRLHGDRQDRAGHRHHQGDRADLRVRLFPEEFARTLHQISEGVIDVSRVVTGKVGLSEVAQAFVTLGDPDPT
uniref:Alcohol dehydrogenase catalytic domain-containing protein n=1 Tax=Phenylobacterium glaciei TaxID=2803784 RepID=A0A974P0S0_9CAUL|nr:alcohol dehydrogenase catalytic domain-containing protein [Phenylobacterium glaciei]